MRRGKTRTLDRRKTTVPISKTGKRFLAAIFSVFGLFLFWILVDYSVALFRASASTSWKTAPGTILSSHAVRGCGKGGSYYPAVQYQYSVGAVQHLGSRLAFGNVGCGAEAQARVTLEQFPVGSSVAVYVNPENPTDSVLQTHVLEETKVGLVLVTPIFLFLILYVRWLLVSAARSTTR
jgi:hypothetical protein